MSWLHAVIDVPADQEAAAKDFWSRALGWPAGDPWTGHPELCSFEPPSGAAYVHLQRIEGPGRVHIDVEQPDPAEAVQRAVELGAELVAERDAWRTLASPGGLPFCVLQARDRVAPAPVTLPEGHRSRLVQVCIDSPGDAHDDEVAFWRAFLPFRWAGSDRFEFAGKWHDDAGSPLQLLFQRLDETGGPVRAHLDLGTDDLPAEIRRIRSLGATDVCPGSGWHVLRDPLDRLFCVTENPPDQATARDLG
jgi:predicted enzyme related to lactoylglutathione lyase